MPHPSIGSRLGLPKMCAMAQGDCPFSCHLHHTSKCSLAHMAACCTHVTPCTKASSSICQSGMTLAPAWGPACMLSTFVIECCRLSPPNAFKPHSSACFCHDLLSASTEVALTAFQVALQPWQSKAAVVTPCMPAAVFAGRATSHTRQMHPPAKQLRLCQPTYT